MRTTATAAVLLAAMALAAASPARAELLSPKAPETVRAAMEEHGWVARLKAKPEENPVIETNRDGIKALVIFMNCEDDHTGCRSVQFYMGFTDAKATTLERLNEWNQTKRFGRAYRDKDGDPVLEMDVDMDFDGIPKENFLEHLTTWSDLMGAFRRHVYTK
jgi:hypothetical protein